MKKSLFNWLLIFILSFVSAVSPAADNKENSNEFGFFILEIDLPDSPSPTFNLPVPATIKFGGTKLVKEVPLISLNFKPDTSTTFPSLFNDGQNRIVFFGKLPTNFIYNSIALYFRYFDRPYFQLPFSIGTSVTPLSFHNLGSIKKRQDGITQQFDWAKTPHVDFMAKSLRNQLSEDPTKILNVARVTSSPKSNFHNKLTYTFLQPAERDGTIIVPNAGGPILKRNKNGSWSAHKFEIDESFVSASFLPNNQPLLATSTKLYSVDFENKQLKELPLPSDKFIRMAHNCDPKKCYLALQEKGTVTLFASSERENPKWEKIGASSKFSDTEPYLLGQIHLGNEIKIPMNLAYKNEVILVGKISDDNTIQFNSFTLDNHAFFDDKQSTLPTQQMDFNYYYVDSAFLSKKLMTNKAWNEPAKASPLNYDLWSVYVDGSGFGIHQTYDENIYFRRNQNQEWENSGVGKFKVSRFYRDMAGNVFAFGGDGQVADLGKGDRWKDIKIEFNNKKN